MIYSFHHYYHWLKGGVETGQANRAKLFRKLGLEAKFVFTTLFPDHNIWNETRQLGYLNSEVLWMYSFFTDCKPSKVTYTLEQLEDTFDEEFIFSRKDSVATYKFPSTNTYYNAFLMDASSDLVHSVVLISNACLVRKDFYTYCRAYSEYYFPMNGQAILYMRRYFNEDGSVAYEELLEGGTILYKFPERVLYSREELVGYMMTCLHITENDVVLIDGEWGMIHWAAFIQNAFPAKIGFILHSNHFRESDEEHILWYDVFGYAFSHPEKISFFATNTDAQSSLLREQFRYYKGLDVRVETIPVAYLDRIRVPKNTRRKHSLITAGRLQGDKRTNWIISAVVMARKEIPDLTLDIFGEGDDKSKLQEQIGELDCGEYVHLCGFHNLDEVYQGYEGYISASYGETFGITLMEAIGSGLSIVGFDVPYGMQVFVDNEKNGYRISLISVEGLANGIIRLFTEADLEAFRRHSYKKAEDYLEEKIEQKWREVLS